LASLVNHRKLCVVVAAAAGVLSDAGDVRHVSVVQNSHSRLVRKVLEVTDELLTLRKHLLGVGAEALWRLIVVDVSDKRVPVVTQVELDVRFARVTLVDADQLIVAWILLKEAPYPRRYIANFT